MDGRPEKESGDLGAWELSHSVWPPVNLVYRHRRHAATLVYRRRHAATFAHRERTI